MSWLGGWLRELVLVVLMATFVEMLLPGKSMQRYARLVLSLLVLLTMLSPIVNLLQGNAAAELGEAFSRQEAKVSRMDSGDDLAAILAAGRKLSAGRQKDSLKLAAAEVAERMKEDIAASGTDRRRITVTVALAMDPDKVSGAEVPVISAVKVVLAPPAASVRGAATPGSGTAGGGTSAGTAGGAGHGAADEEADAAEPANAGGAAGSPAGSYGSPIEVAPVEAIKVGDGSGGPSVPAGGAPQSAADAAAAAREAKSVAGLLERGWELAPGTVTVEAGGAGGGSAERF